MTTNFKSSKYSDTSSVMYTENDNDSDTSLLQFPIKNKKNIILGGNNAFKSKYSDTSSQMYTENDDDSVTSSYQIPIKNDIFRGGNNLFESKYSDTSSQIYNEDENENENDSITSSYQIPIKNDILSGGNNQFKSKYSDTSSQIYNEDENENENDSITSSYQIPIKNDILNGGRYSKNIRSDMFSETSVINQVNNELETSDTLRSISELKERKSNLNINIFKKTQTGGTNTSDLKKKMLEVGIHSNTSSTSSICE